MGKSSYYKTSSLFKTTGSALKKAALTQQTLNSAGLMINRITLKTHLMPTSSMKGVKLSGNKDLFLSGRFKPSYIKMKIKIEAIAKS